MTPRWNALWVLAAALLASHAALAAPQGDDGAMGFDEPTAAENDAPSEPASEDTAFLAGEQTEEQKALAAPEEEKDVSRAEDPSKPYYLVGARFRWLMVPKWFIDMFGVDSRTKDGRHLLINNVGAGAEFTYRKDGLDITAAIWWAGLSWDGNVAFKGSDEEVNSWEVVKNSTSSLLFSVDFIWSTSFTDWFAITYGVGIGIGIPLGQIERTESENPDPLDPCEQDDMDDGDPEDWCNSGEQYHEVYKLPTGIVPWINLLGGMRFKPARHFAIYTDFGFGIGFQAGVRGGYIF